MSLQSFPQSARQIFWSCNLNDLDENKHKDYIIHQVLQYGDLSDYEWLQTVYSSYDIKDVFINKPKSTYQPKSYNFVKNYLLKIQEPLDKKNYVRSAL